MRLLELKKHGEFSLTKELINNTPPYAILSHTWGDDDEEVTFKDLVEGFGKNKAGYRKIQFCGEQAARDGLQYFWVDTCCIDKSDNTALSEAINSMYHWYHKAAKCYVYLSDVSANNYNQINQSFQWTWEPAFRKSIWFTRGWTLQELIAPSSVEFFSLEGKKLGCKKLLERQIHEITGIPIPAFQGSSLSDFSVKERMSWAGKRETKREEDLAYCLLGIFDIHMPLIYGEGTKAFIRLREGIKKSSMDKTLARSPALFLTHEDGEVKSFQTKFLSHLRFQGINEREERVLQAHESTFEWMFRDPEPKVKPWANFIKWLEQGTEIYWITGKPGSGKSTLMKFLQRDPRTIGYLKTWATDRSRLIMACFYFWNSGTELQMSYNGLLRSLLYGLTSEESELIPRLFPDRWEKLLQLPKEDQDPWTSVECLRALREIKSMNFYKFVFFIDGLDEFHGDHMDIITLLKDLASSSNVKVCASSRPWVQFQDEFRVNPSLMLQDLTFVDIEIYLKTKFSENPRFTQMKRHDPALAMALYKEVASRSSGVFLWVRLVVRTLLDGVSNGDRVSDLYSRLDAIPEDLEEFFWKMLSSSKKESHHYFEHAAKLFQICQCHPSPYVLFLSFADDDDEVVLESKLRPLSDEEIGWRIDSMKRRLNSRTKGLLEVGEPSGLDDTVLGKDTKVQYLHRTVKDFIERPDIWQKLTKIPFDPHLSLCKAYLLECKFFDLGAGRLGDLHVFINRALDHARNANPSSHAHLISILDRLNDVAETFAKNPNCYPEKLYAKPPRGYAILLPLALRDNLNFWIKWLVEKNQRGMPPKRRTASFNSWIRKYDYNGVQKLHRLATIRWPCRNQTEREYEDPKAQNRRLEGKQKRRHDDDADVMSLRGRKRRLPT